VTCDDRSFALASMPSDMSTPYTSNPPVASLAPVSRCSSRWMRSARMPVPQAMSATLRDPADLSRATTPQLTTVRQPLQEMGRMAVSLLTRLLDRHEVEALHVELATELIVRGSTGPASTIAG